MDGQTAICVPMREELVTVSVRTRVTAGELVHAMSWRKLFQCITTRHNEIVKCKHMPDSVMHFVMVGRLVNGTFTTLNSPERPPYWNSTSGFDFDHITTVDCDMSFCTSL